MSRHVRYILSSCVARSSATHSLLTSTVIGIMVSFGTTQANAELLIHNEPSQQIKVAKIAGISSSQIKSQTLNIQSINTQIPSDISIIKLMQVMHLDEQIDAIVNSQQVAIDTINTQTSNRAQQTGDDKAGDKKLNKRQRELQTQIQGLLGQYAKIMTNSIDDATDVETMTQAYINAAKSYYSQAEVDAQIEFYDSVIGQSILAKQPQVTADFLKQSLPDDMSDTKNQLSELLPQMKQIIKSIL